MFEKYQKAARAGPDKREREEIEALKEQVCTTGPISMYNRLPWGRGATGFISLHIGVPQCCMPYFGWCWAHTPYTYTKLSASCLHL